MKVIIFLDCEKAAIYLGLKLISNKMFQKGTKS